MNDATLEKRLENALEVLEDLYKGHIVSKDTLSNTVLDVQVALTRVRATIMLMTLA